MSAVHADRLRRAASLASELGLAAVIVPPSPDLIYLTGYDPMPLERPTLLVVRADRDPMMLVPELERPLAAASPVGDLTGLVGWRDGVDPYTEAAALLPRHGRIAVSDRLWAVHLLGLQRALATATFEAASPALGRLRAVKDAAELDALRRAGEAADATFDRIVGEPFSGRTERDIAARLAELLVEQGHAAAEFTIVATGPNGASPHHEPTARLIEPGDAVVMDFGGALDGYHSDTTRTVVVERAPDGFEEVYGVVREAQEAGVGAVHPGVLAQDVDRAARSVIQAAGYGERFVHRTGHGIGLEVHEPPSMLEGDETVIESGMTFSVEPGVYLEGRFGIRIEDIVAVTHEGVERLNRSTRDLRYVG